MLMNPVKIPLKDSNFDKKLSKGQFGFVDQNGAYFVIEKLNFKK